MTRKCCDCKPETDLAEWSRAWLRLCAGGACLAVGGYATTAAILLIMERFLG